MIMIAIVLGMLALCGCYGTVSVGVPIGAPYGPYGGYGGYGGYGPYGGVRVSSGPIIW
jgi:hypothetical protein